MSSSYVIDSSVFISALNSRDPHFRASKIFWETTVKEKTSVILPVYIVLEVLNVLRRNTLVTESELEEIHRQMTQAESFHLFSWDQIFLESFLKEGPRLHLKTSDLAIAFTAFKTGSSLVTWDKKLLQQAAKVVQAATPAQWRS